MQALSKPKQIPAVSAFLAFEVFADLEAFIPTAWTMIVNTKKTNQLIKATTQAV